MKDLLVVSTRVDRLTWRRSTGGRSRGFPPRSRRSLSGRFVLRSSATDPCTGELRRSGDVEGIYEQVGRSLVFRPGPDARYWFYRHGILRKGELVFLGAGNDLIFRR